MKVPISWVKDYVDIDLPLEELAHRLTMAGLEVDDIRLLGLPMPEGDKHEFKIYGLSWEPDRLVVAQIDEVMPHPNADRLVLCRLNDGQQEHVVLTGAPNLYPFKGQGPLPQPLKVAYAKEGARIYDGHQPGQVLTTLKRAKIRGVESYSMVCSEKELGISEEHEGVIILDPDAPTGMPLVDYMGDAVLEISILPNMIRNASILGVAREIAAFTGKPLRRPDSAANAAGPSIEGRAAIQITEPELNPRFAAGIIENVSITDSPYLIQRRLRLAGMRPINNIVDATNYVMLEIGQPLHAFDYDVLVQRAGGKAPTIITRAAQPGETLTTLDGVEHRLDPFTILVCDTAGALSIAGVMGGQESEVGPNTRNILLEGATWNFINIRKTVAAQRMTSEAAYRFSRGVHPELAPLGVKLGLKRMAAWSGGEIARGLVDNYPLPAVDPVVTITPGDVKRHLGLDLSASAIADLLTRLEFECRVEGETVSAKTPPHRLDIGEGIVGAADLMEEIARVYGYDNIPPAPLAEPLPTQRNNRPLEVEERVRDTLASLGLQEVMTYRLTSPEREARLSPSGAADPGPYLGLLNPITPDRQSMRRSLLSSVMEIAERNARLRDRLALFEIGPVFLPECGGVLPAEVQHLAIVMTGLRGLPSWDVKAQPMMDFFDLKAVLEALLDELHISGAHYEPVEAPGFHPGKCARITAQADEAPVALGVFGELHPQVKARYDLGPAPVLAADLDLAALIALSPERFQAKQAPVFPPVLEDIAVVVDESLPAGEVEAAIRKAGGALLSGVRLFDIFRGGQIGEGKKSLAYSLTYQAPDRTLTDADASKLRAKIIRALEQDLGAKLRS